jgi:hypothetical protein
MLFLAYYWLSLPRTFGDEAFFIKWSSLVKKSLLGIDEKPAPEEVLFVDVSGSKTTIANDEQDLSFFQPHEVERPFHRKVITDRQDLADLFHLLNQNKQDIKFVLCDILFEDTTAYDRKLQQEIEGLEQKILGVSHLQEGKRYMQPLIEMPNASATYRSADGLFLKFPLILEDSIKTAPLVMHEKIDGARFNKRGAFYFINQHLSLPLPIVDFKVRQSDFETSSDLQESNYAKIPMGTILESSLFMDSLSLADYFKGKIILIGDFETDIHSTPFGETPGLLLIYNAYLTLTHQQYVISFWWILFLFISFFILSYRIFADVKVRKPVWLVNIFQTRAGKYILNALDEMALLIVVTLGSYFLFNIHINILILFIYLKVAEWIWKRFFPAVPSGSLLESA